MPRPAVDLEDPRVKTAVFGQEVEDWLRSPIGDYVLKRAQAEADDAIEKLKRVKPNEEHRIRELQAIIHRAEGFMGWLGAAVQDGMNALNSLEGEEEAHGEAEPDTE